MNIVILFIICSLFALIFYVYDTYKHKKLMLETAIDFHWQEKQLIEIKADSIKSDYPLLSKVVTSLTYSDVRFNSKKILKHAKSVDDITRNQLRNEMSTAIERDDDTAIHVIRWYYMACLLINATENHYSQIKDIIDINENTKRMSNIKNNKLEIKDPFCLA
ncbi:hypothetical protein [Streptococcus dysgalactiae]|uniref:hypothetical protein n=1 Tax=Streptococcus dysgalactiae TaxID=1334 RepID=UPI003A72E9B6